MTLSFSLPLSFSYMERTIERTNGQHGVDVNGTDSCGRTPLSVSRTQEVSDLLLRSGARRTAADVHAPVVVVAPPPPPPPTRQSAAAAGMMMQAPRRSLVSQSSSASSPHHRQHHHQSLNNNEHENHEDHDGSNSLNQLLQLHLRSSDI